MHLTTQADCGILIGASDQFARVSPDGSKVRVELVDRLERGVIVGVPTVVRRPSPCEGRELYRVQPHGAGELGPAGLRPERLDG